MATNCKNVTLRVAKIFPLISVKCIEQHKFLGVPASKPRLWIDLSSTASKRAGLAMHSPGRKILRWVVKVLRWFAWLPIEKILYGPVKSFDELDGHDVIKKAIRVPIDFMTLYTGNNSVRSKLTALVRLRRYDDPLSMSEVIVKMGRTLAAADAMRNEIEVLTKLAGSSLRSQVPVAIGRVKKEGEWTWSVQSVLPKGESPLQLQREHYKFLDELKRTGLSHGDFAPWNCSIFEGKLYVWDWEDAGPWVEGKDVAWFKKQVKELLGVDS